MIRISGEFRVDDMIRRALLLSIAIASTAFAQKSDATPLCWRARPLAKCKTWLVTETAFENVMSTTSGRRVEPGGTSYDDADFSPLLAFTVGGMRNVSAREAVGLTGSLMTAEPASRLELRYRRWLGPEQGVDVSGGLAAGIMPGLADASELPARGFTGAIGISTTYVGADARLDLLRKGGRTIHATYLGIRAGSRAAPIVAATGFALFMGLFYLATRGGDY